MNRHSNPSPRIRTTPQNKQVGSAEEKDLLILNLQSKLQTLEEKYTLFISKCSELLKSDNLKSETRDYFSECSSSVRFSPEFLISQEDLQENQSLLQYLKEIEQGDLLKQHMNAISDLINKSQEALLDQLKHEKSHEKCIQNNLAMLKSQLWDLLFRKEEILKVTIKSCLNKFQLFDKILEDSLSTVKYKRKMKEFKKKYLGTCEENEGLLMKIREQHECLNKIQADHAKLKNRIMAGSVMDYERQPKRGRLTFEFQQDLFSNSLVSSPNLNSSRKLQESTKKFHSRGKNLSLQNSILNQAKNIKNNESSSIEIEKKEIQEQLKALNNKLAGFEKIAKNLIDSGIRAELSLIGQNHSVQTRNIKNDESSQLSPLISLLEFDKIQKDFEKSLTENKFLNEILDNEKKKSEDLWKKCAEKDKVMKDLWQEFERLKKKNEEAVEEYEGKILKEKEKIREFEDQARNLLEKLEISENEKLDLSEQLSKYVESGKELEEKMKKLEQDCNRLQESAQVTKTSEDNALYLTNKLSLVENSLQISKNTNEKLQDDYESLKSSYDELQKSQQSLLESLQNANNNTNDLCNLTLALESSQLDYKKLMSKYDSYKKASEKIISDKDKIISSFELKNLENFKLTGEISSLQASSEESQQEILRLKNENENLDKKISELLILIDKHEKTIKNFEVDNIQTASKVKGLMEGVKELNIVLKENCEKLKVAEDEKAALALENKKLAGKVKALGDRYKSDEGTLEFLGNTVEERDRIIEEMKVKEQEIRRQVNEEISEKNKQIDRKNKEIDEKNKQIDQKNKEMLTLSKEINEKIKEIADKVQELQSKNKEIDEKNKEIHAKNEEIDEKNKILSTKSAEIKALEAQISSAKLSSSSLENEKTQLINQLQALKEHQTKSDKIISEKSALIQTYEQSLKDLENLNTALKSSSASNFELQNLKQDLLNLQQKLENSEEKLKKSEQDLHSTQESWTLCKNQLKLVEEKHLVSIQNERNLDKSGKDCENIKKTLESELSLVKIQLNQASLGLNSKQNQIDSLKSDLASRSEQSEKTIFDLQEKLKTLSADLNDLQNIRAELLEKQAKAQKNWEKDRKKFESNEQSLSLIVQNLTNSNENLKKSLQDSQNTVKKLKTQLTRLHSGLKNLNIPSLKQSLQDYSHFFQVKSSDFKNFIINPQNLSMFSTLFQIFTSSNKLEKAELQSTKSIIQKKLEYVEREKDQLSKNLAEEAKILEKAIVENIEFKGKLMSLETDYSKLQQKIVKNEENAELVKALREKIADLEADCLKLQQKLVKSEENEDVITNLKGKIEGFKHTNSELVIELEKYKKQVSDLSSMNEKLNLQIMRSLRDNEDLKGDLEVYNTKIIEKNKQIEKLSEKMENFKETSIDSKDFEKQISLKKQELHAMNHENMILSKKLDEKNKYIEETSKSLNLLKVDNERLLKEVKSLKASNENIVENILEKDLIIRRLEDTIVSMETLIKSSEKTEEELRAALSFVQNQLDNKLLQPKSDPNMFLKPENNPNAMKNNSFSKSKDLSKADSVASKSGVIEKQSGYTDELNITPCKILRVIKVNGKKWVLCGGENGEYVWKDENNLHVSGADTLLEAEEDLDEIKAALGDHYRGNIIEAIESLKSKANDLNLSAHFIPTEKNENFKGEFFGAGLDLSNIDMKLQDDNFDQLNNDLVNKNLELIEKEKKIAKKKKEVLLLREENKVLKDQFREFEEKKKDMENKVQSSLAVNLPYLKLVFSNLIGKVKVDKSLEDFIVVIYKILDFSQDEINQLQGQRKGKKVLKSK